MAPNSSDLGSDLVGSRLAKIRLLALVLLGHAEKETLQFEIKTNKGVSWTILSGADGESIHLERRAIDDADAFVIGDFADRKILDLTEPKVGLALHKEITQIETFYLFEELLIGLRIVMYDGSWLEIFNIGDNLSILINEYHALSNNRDVSAIQYGL
jgi:hypothetical protein